MITEQAAELHSTNTPTACGLRSRTRGSKRALRRLCGGLTMLVLLSGCAVNSVDPSFAAYETTAAVNPKSSAIVGLWQRKLDKAYGAFGEYTMKNRSSILFRADGTGIKKGFVTSSSNDFEIDSPPLQFRWNYLGGGVWGVRDSQWRFKVAGDRLLAYLGGDNGTVNELYTRE